MVYEIDIINVCIYHYSINTKILNISKMLNISKQIIYIWINKYNFYFVNNIQLTKEIYKNKPIHGSSKNYLYEKTIIDYVNNNNGCTLNDILKDNFNNNNIKISKSSICKILKKNNITRKKIINKNLPISYDELCQKRQEYSKLYDKINFINYISIDESSFCVDDYNKKGYSRKGNKITNYHKHKHTKERRTLLSAINKSGFVANKIIKGSVNKDIYLNFFEENIHHFINKHIIHDNARIHHSIILKEFCNYNNIHLHYTPPYTPDFNPIEMVFSEIKYYYRKYLHNNIIIDINESIKQVNTNNFINYYNYSLSKIQSFNT